MAVMPPGLEVAVYDVIAVPPFTTGGVKATVICPTPAVTAPIVGAFGTVAGITLGELPDAGPVPIAFVAFTVKV